jgi:2',3'-cyclic-nucleotide 2'-phosphodiesterase
MEILFIGDVVGSDGRDMVATYLPQLKQKYQPTFTIVNGENAAGGKGITEKIAKRFFENGAQVVTLGNHTWDQKGTEEYLDSTHNVIRPANYPPDTPGNGYAILNVNRHKVAVISLQGRTFLPAIDCPFRTVEKLVEQIRKQTSIIIVDFHAEATSEKEAMGWFLDGKVSAVLGTHTHVQTADEKLLPKQTAYLTDVGMTGPRDAVLGMKKEAVLYRFLTTMPTRFEVAKDSSAQLNAVLLSVHPQSGQAERITRIIIDEDHPFRQED